jgi:hypothetical protein
VRAPLVVTRAELGQANAAALWVAVQPTVDLVGLKRPAESLQQSQLLRSEILDPRGCTNIGGRLFSKTKAAAWPFLCTFHGQIASHSVYVLGNTRSTNYVPRPGEQQIGETLSRSKAQQNDRWAPRHSLGISTRHPSESSCR